jgi:hypothetical protein
MADSNRHSECSPALNLLESCGTISAANGPSSGLSVCMLTGWIIDSKATTPNSLTVASLWPDDADGEFF